ncbi:autophagy-related protein 27-domain-containing protein [Mycena filopes]|nr:autophagy-related protein 27-domain-containing protein [Mycena filopes]
MRLRTCLLGLSWSLIKVAAADYPCKFTLGNFEFDLCPLFSETNKTVSWGEATPPTFSTYRYVLGLDAPLKRDFQLPVDEQCPDATRICLTVVNTRPKHPSEPARIFQVVPVAGDVGLNPKAKLLPKIHPNDLHEPLQVTLHGGLYNNQPQKAAFQFQCDHDVNEPTLPEFSWKFNGTHAFSWRTKHACPRALPPGAPPPAPQDPDTDPPAIPPSDPDADVVGDKDPHRTPLSALIKLVSAVLIIFGLRFSYPLISRWSRRLPWRFPKTRIGSFGSMGKGFRPSPSSLVQWAREESVEEYEIDGFSDGEETPLTPNSRATFAISQYGSAR